MMGVFHITLKNMIPLETVFITKTYRMDSYLDVIDSIMTIYYEIM